MTVTTYAPEGYPPNYSTKYITASVDEDDPPREVMLNFQRFCGDGWDFWVIDREYLLKMACQAYLHGKDTATTWEEMFAARLAGYELEDYTGGIWEPVKTYLESGFTMDEFPHKIIRPEDKPPETITITISRAEYDALKAQVEKLGEGA